MEHKSKEAKLYHTVRQKGNIHYSMYPTLDKSQPRTAVPVNSTTSLNVMMRGPEQGQGGMWPVSMPALNHIGSQSSNDRTPSPSPVFNGNQSPFFSTHSMQRGTTLNFQLPPKTQRSTSVESGSNTSSSGHQEDDIDSNSSSSHFNAGDTMGFNGVQIESGREMPPMSNGVHIKVDNSNSAPVDTADVGGIIRNTKDLKFAEIPKERKAKVSFAAHVMDDDKPPMEIQIPPPDFQERPKLSLRSFGDNVASIAVSRSFSQEGYPRSPSSPTSPRSPPLSPRSDEHDSDSVIGSSLEDTRSENSYGNHENGYSKDQDSACGSDDTEIEVPHVTCERTALLSDDGKHVMVQVSCETESTANSDKFLDLMCNIAQTSVNYFTKKKSTLLHMNGTQVQQLPLPDGRHIKEHVAEVARVFSEKVIVMGVACYKTVEKNYIGIHMTDRICSRGRCTISKSGVLVALKKINRLAPVEEFSEQLCRHILESKPETLGKIQTIKILNKKGKKLPKEQLLAQNFIYDPTVTVYEAAKKCFVDVVDFQLFA